MKKTVVVLGSMLALVLGACLPFSPTQTPGTGPTVDLAQTVDAALTIAVAQTLTAQPTVVSVTETPVLASPIPAATETPVATFTPVVDLSASPTTTFTAVVDLTTTPATATLVPGVPTFTATLAAGQVTASPTLGIRTYGTLPPAVPFSHITLINKAKTEAYISLQVTMPDGRYSIIEYPVEGKIKIQAPIGYYLYVAWVGGNKMVGEFNLHHNEELSIFLYKDKIVVQ